MAAYTINESDAGKATRFLATLAATNAADSEVAAVKVPGWARYLSVFIFVDSQGGTTPALDLDILVPDFGSAAKMAAPDDGNPAVLATLTTVTGTGPYQQRIDIGPGVTGIADDATGAASADAVQSVNAVLPPWLAYNFRTTAGDADEDVSARLVFVFRP